jgi:polyketide synthase PksJ
LGVQGAIFQKSPLAAGGKLIINEFEKQVRERPDRLAVKQGLRMLTYRDLDSYANRVAGLISRHWPEGRGFGTIGLFLDHGIDMIAAILGVLKAGKAYVPLAPSYPFKRVVYMLEHSEAVLVLSHVGCEEQGKKMRLSYDLDIPLLDIDLDYTLMAEGSAMDVEMSGREINGKQMAYIMYTSGSTGNPKGVVQNHENVLYYTRNWVHQFSIDASSRMTLFSSFCHDGSVQDMFVALLSGASLYPYDVRNPDPGFDLAGFIIEEKITIWHSVPSLFNFFVNSLKGGEDFAELKWILLGGEPFRGYEIEMFKQYFPASILANVYGQTESSVDSIWTLGADDPVGHLTIGEPLDRTRIFIVDKEGRELGPLETGEILIACPHITPGYWQGDEMSNNCFADDPDLGRMFWTGDLGRMLPDGMIEFIGREDFQVKIRGFRVEVGEIETTLLQVDGIREAVVIARQPEPMKHYLCAFITALRPMDTRELREYLTEELPDYMIPATFVQLETMPLTHSGKINRLALAEMEEQPLTSREPFVEPFTEMEKIVARACEEVLKLDRIGVNENLFDLGANSFDIIQINNRLTRELGQGLPIVNLFRFPTVGTFAARLGGQEQEEQEGVQGSRTRPSAGIAGQPFDIAVIGLAGRFPGAATIDRFWENLKNGTESVTFFPEEELRDARVPEGMINHPDFVNAKGVVEDIELFDAAFFDYTPLEVEVMDPQLRLLHECSWEALEHAGYDPSGYEGLIGLYAGNAPNHLWAVRTYFSRRGNPLGQFEAGLLTNHFSTRVSYNLDLKGPAISVQTACSTSLVGIHLACLGLHHGECDMALAGGASVSFPLKSGYVYREGLIFSSDGHCRAFDRRADGTLFGDGAGIVVLKKLDRALADNDNIYAVIKGSAINNDGHRKAWYTAPGIDGQAAVIRAAQDVAQVEPKTITYIETHGTGTSLGDPIEIEALNTVFHKNRKNSCAVGSVKTNLGHLNAAAGVAGFIKAVLSLKHRMIPPSLHYEMPNPQIDFIDSPFYVNAVLTSWDNGETPLRAGVSSFGFGGTNAHVVLEEWCRGVIINAPSNRPESGAGIRDEYRLLVLSARTQTAFEKMRENLAGYFREHPGISLADAAYTLHIGRKAFNYRWMAVISSVEEAVDVLSVPAAGEMNVLTAGEEGNSAEVTVPVRDRESLERFGRLWLSGVKVKWQGLYVDEKRSRIPLPAYPFERQRYWIDESPFAAGMKVLREKMPQAGSTDMADWFYLPSWKRSVLHPQRRMEPGTFGCRLVFMNNSNLDRLLVEELRHLGKVVVVEQGETYVKSDQTTYTLNPMESRHYKALLQELLQDSIFPDQIIHIWNVTGESSQNKSFAGSRGGFSKEPLESFYSIFYLARVLGGFSRDVQVTVLTNRLQDVLGDEELEPLKAPVLGLLKVIPQEYPGIDCRVIDIPVSGSLGEQELCRALIDELCTDSQDPVIAYRNNQRWVQVFDPFRLDRVEGELPILKEGGVYLIAGGLGDIGLMVSELLVKHVKAKLVLTGRSSLPVREEWEQWLENNRNDRRWVGLYYTYGRM